MKKFVRSLFTRKFLLAFGATLVFIGEGQYDLALYTVLGYLGVEGVGDAVERYAPESSAHK